MPTTPPYKTRQWLLATLDKAGTRLAALEAAGATTLEAEWSDADGTTVRVKKNGDGCVLTISFPDGKNQVGPLTFPYGWLSAS